MTEQSAALVEATVRQHCKTLRLPTIGSQFVGLSAEAVKGKQSHVEYLEALLAAELVLGRDRYCLNYTRAYRAGVFDKSSGRG